MATSLEIAVPALCAWRENRAGQKVGMQSVLNVLQNRALKNNPSLYAEAVKPEQFTSISPPPNMAAKNSEADVWPQEGDALYITAEQMVGQALESTLPDITQGATLYYNPSGIGETANKFTLPGGGIVDFPDGWNENAVAFTVEIAQQLFFREVSS